MKYETGEDGGIFIRLGTEDDPRIPKDFTIRARVYPIEGSATLHKITVPGGVTLYSDRMVGYAPRVLSDEEYEGIRAFLKETMKEGITIL